MEAELACEIARLSWKLRRAERYEHAVLSLKVKAKIGSMVGGTDTSHAMELDMAAFDDDAEGQRRRRMISGIRGSLSRARKELRQWQEAHPDPAEVVEEDEDASEIGFVRADPEATAECDSLAAAPDRIDPPGRLHGPHVIAGLRPLPVREGGSLASEPQKRR